MNFEHHPLLPTLVKQYAAEDPAFHRTVRVLYNQGAAATEVMCALATHAYEKVPLSQTAMGPDTSVVAPDFAALYARVTPPHAEYTPPNGVQLTKLVRTPTGDWEGTTVVRFAPVIFVRTFIFPDTVASRLLAAMPLADHERHALRAAKPGDAVRIHGSLLVGLTSTARTAVLADGVTVTAMVVSRARLKEFDADVTLDAAGERY